MTTLTETPRKQGLLHRPERPYWHPYLGGVLLGLVLFLAFFFTGNGLGASGAISRLDAFLVDRIAPGHVDLTPYLLKMAGGAKNSLDDWIIPVFFGALVGGFISGIVNGRAKVETNKGPHISVRLRWLFAFIGGAIMVYGARMARGCTSGQALSGGATLSAGSWVVMMAIFAGAYMLAYFVRRLWL